MHITKIMKFAMLLAASILFFSNQSRSEEVLDDSELARITGQGYAVDTSVPNMLSFNFDDIGAHKQIDGSGNIQLRKLSQLSNGNNSISISDNAQSNLRAMMNINAANAVIQVLMNLNINIDSEVASIVQENMANGL